MFSSNMMRPSIF